MINLFSFEVTKRPLAFSVQDSRSNIFDNNLIKETRAKLLNWNKMQHEIEEIIRL